MPSPEPIERTSWSLKYSQRSHATQALCFFCTTECHWYGYSILEYRKQAITFTAMDVLQTQKQRRQLYKYRQVTLGHVLKGLREERNLKQSDIAVAVGIGQSDVSKLESGERSIKVVEIDVYAYALGMSVGEFVKQMLEVMLLADDGMR